MSADSTARTVRQVDDLDPVRVLQRVLYRSAKQNRTCRFHALFDYADFVLCRCSDECPDHGGDLLEKFGITTAGAC
jgi:hypothetical protein